MEFLIQTGEMAGRGIVYVAIAYCFIFLNKYAADAYARSKGFCPDQEIEEYSNLAVALRRIGLYLGLGLAFYGVISGPSFGFMNDVVAIASYGFIASLFFFGARVANDFVVLGSMSNTEEVRGGNVAVGLVECGAFIATGFIAMGSMQGLGGGYLTAIAFFIVGQFILWAVTVGYEAVTSFSMKKEIENGNPAAGLQLGGLMVAVALGIHGAVAYDFVSWSYNLTALLIDGSIVVLMMVLVSLVIDRVFFKGTNIKQEIVRDHNVAAIGVVVTLKIVAALLVSASII